MFANIHTQARELDRILSVIINKIFQNDSLLKNDQVLNINQLLIQLINIMKMANLNKHDSFINDSLFSMIYNLTKQKKQSNKYIDLCILNDMANSLIEFLGKMNQINIASFSNVLQLYSF